MNETLLTSILDDNIRTLQGRLAHCDDIVVRRFEISDAGSARNAALIYTDGLADTTLISDHLMNALLFRQPRPLQAEGEVFADSLMKDIQHRTLPIGNVTIVHDTEAVLSSVLTGDTIVLFDGSEGALCASTKGWKDRGVGETEKESVVRGPRESFSESIRTNTALIRRKIKDPNLAMESRLIGRITRTDVSIMYLKGIAEPSIVEEVRNRLQRIETDSILESGYIEEWIQDSPGSPFPTIFNSERPDVIAAEILEGKVAILTDGSPSVLVVPALFVSFLHSPEDYYERSGVSTFIRVLRIFGIFISLLGPSLYIAVTTFHQDMLPTELLISLAAQREGIPFPAFQEAIMMELAFEIMREAGLRLPKTIGQTISIVGSLVIGQAAAEAGIVSPAMIIVVAITAISSFLLPAYNMSIPFRLMRFPMMVAAGCFGLYGIFLGCMLILLHMCGLRSFGVPFMSPFSPYSSEENKDAILRMPQRFVTARPESISKRKPKRSKPLR